MEWIAQKLKRKKKPRKKKNETPVLYGIGQLTLSIYNLITIYV